MCRKQEEKQECDNAEKQLNEIVNLLKITEDSRQPLFIKKKEIQRSIVKFQTRQKALDKMAKDIEYTQNELKREHDKSTKYESQNSVSFI